MEQRKYLLQRQPIDERDRTVSVALHPNVALPPICNVEGIQAEVFNQKNLGSCFANAYCVALKHELEQVGKIPVAPIFSRLFAYFVAREHKKADTGVIIRDGLKRLRKTGTAPESIWTYITSLFSKKPSSKAYSLAAKYNISEYCAVPQELSYLRVTLADGKPILCGISIFDSFERTDAAKTGIIPMPNLATEKDLGGHAMLVIGYDDTKQVFRVRNSWGKDWGDKGDCYIPYNYMIDRALAFDFWTIYA